VVQLKNMPKIPTIRLPWLGLLSIIATGFAILEGRFGPPCLGSLFVWLGGSAIGFVFALVALIIERPRMFAAAALLLNVVAVTLSFIYDKPST
jgi:hypothetical protein